ncbi:MAG: bifunctional hydroxymethylpyrimidine kinase/phosphomethylpyrimidine kinase [Crocinitomicaceae bacterium]|jgi:hydroxymethylpyrimidine/phosphomethylpyrimidine kinase|nr:bifunctional hydroxymethylpyrimidine kinase/phosphomethylpyrimidine kinase [Crocinitomicaceae bacterium]
MSRKRPICLTIAGFDPSGGAGLLADCKTFEQHKVLGMAVQTANTIQTEDSFLATHWEKHEVILAQLDTLLSRYRIHFFKIGLIENVELLQAILKRIEAHSKKAVVIWDPVIKASALKNVNENENESEGMRGNRFDSWSSIETSLDLWVTPNRMEYEQLFKGKESNFSIYLKGGHSENLGKDILYRKGKEYHFQPKVKTTLEKHGTGCILSAAILANLALGYPTLKACLNAKRYLEKRLVSNETLLAFHT